MEQTFAIIDALVRVMNGIKKSVLSLEKCATDAQRALRERENSIANRLVGLVKDISLVCLFF